MGRPAASPCPALRARTLHRAVVQPAQPATTALAARHQQHRALLIITVLPRVVHLSRLAPLVLVAKHQISRQQVQGIATRRALRASGGLGAAARLAPQATPVPVARALSLAALARTRHLQKPQAAPTVLLGNIRVQASRPPALHVRQAGLLLQGHPRAHAPLAIICRGAAACCAPRAPTALAAPWRPAPWGNGRPSREGHPASAAHLGDTEQALGTLPLGSAPIALLERILHLAHRAAPLVQEGEPHHWGRVRAARFVL